MDTGDMTAMECLDALCEEFGIRRNQRIATLMDEIDATDDGDDDDNGDDDDDQDED